MFCICSKLIAHVGKIELALAHLLGDARGLLRIDVRRRLLDQRHHVAHAEDAAGDAGRMEIFQRVGLFAGADQLDRLAGDRAHRQRGAAAAVAVDARQHDAGEADALVEGAREIDRVLAGQRVGDQQHFMRIGGALHFGRFRHHRFVERGAAGGVEQHDVVAAELRRLQRALRDLRRRLALHDRQRLDADVAAEHGELLHRRRAAGVERGHQHLALVALGQAAGELCGGGGFAGALQADHHDGDRRRRVEVDGLAVGAERRDQLVVDDLDDHLAGRHRLDDGGADGLLAHLVGERAHDFERDVGLEQRAAHLAHGRVDVGLGERAAARQPIQNAAKLFRQIVEHVGPHQTRLRPRAHSAVGRWPPASRDRSAGRKESLFEISAGLKAARPKSQEIAAGTGPFLRLHHVTWLAASCQWPETLVNT